MSPFSVIILITYLWMDIAADDIPSCNNETESAHNLFVREEFGRQSQSFYKAAKKHVSDNLTPLVTAANITANDIVLDLGCGPGIISTLIAKNNKPQKVYAMDISKEMLDIARKHASDNGVDIFDNEKIEFIEGNVEHLPFDDNMFDVVITRWTFHHFDKLNKVLKEINRVLKPNNGKLVFLEFCAPNITNSDDNMYKNEMTDVFNAIHTMRDPSHTYAYNEEGWIQQVKMGGFEMQNIDIVDRLQLPMNWHEFIEWTNPDENSKRARQSMNVIGAFLTRCDCDVGLNFHFNQNDDLFIISKYIVVVATKS